MKKYTISCNECKGSREVVIDNDSPLWDNSVTDPSEAKIISARKRLDGEWGWECVCGNTSILSEQERRMIKNPQNPQAQELKKIVSNLIPEKPKFIMEVV